MRAAWESGRPAHTPWPEERMQSPSARERRAHVPRKLKDKCNCDHASPSQFFAEG